MIEEKMRIDPATGEIFYDGNVGLGTRTMFPWSTDLNVVRLGDLGSIATSKLPAGGGYMSTGYNYYTDSDMVDRYMAPGGATKHVSSNQGTFFYQAVVGVAGDQIDWQGIGSFALVGV